jgi:hypothetical protein
MLRRRLLGGVLVLAIAVVGAIVVDQESGPAQEAGGNEYCFAEWCIAPESTTIGIQEVTVRVRVGAMPSKRLKNQTIPRPG